VDLWLNQVNTLYKKVEGIILQLSSFDDSCRQIRRWIEETNQRLTIPGVKEGHNQVCIHACIHFVNFAQHIFITHYSIIRQSKIWNQWSNLEMVVRRMYDGCNVLYDIMYNIMRENMEY